MSPNPTLGELRNNAFLLLGRLEANTAEVDELLAKRAPELGGLELAAWQLAIDRSETHRLLSRIKGR